MQSVSRTVKVCLISLLSFALVLLWVGVTVPYDNLKTYGLLGNVREASQTFPAKVAHENGSSQSLVTTGVTSTRDIKRYNYFAVNDDPKAAIFLHEVLQRISVEIKESMAKKHGLALDDQREQFLWPPRLNEKDRWALLIGHMRELGYEQRLPDIVGIGVMKSATNALNEYLSEHPQIVRSIGEEVRYFNENYTVGLEYYRAKMGFSTIGQHSMEKTPAYFRLESCPERIKKDLSRNVKLLLIVRDPVERLISAHRHWVEAGEKRADAAAVTAESQGRQLVPIIFRPNGTVKETHWLVDQSLYSKHLKRWLGYFPRDRIVIVSHKRLQEDIYSELHRLESSLGLRPFYEKNMFYYDEKRHLSCMKTMCPDNTTPLGGIVPKAKLRPDEIKKLRDFFRPYNQEFRRLTKMDFTWVDL